MTPMTIIKNLAKRSMEDEIDKHFGCYHYDVHGMEAEDIVMKNHKTFYETDMWYGYTVTKKGTGEKVASLIAKATVYEDGRVDVAVRYA